MKYVFEIRTDVGRNVLIIAKSRQAAIETFCQQQYVDEDFIKKHCLIKNKGCAK